MSAPARPTFTNRNAMRAVSAATRRSEATAMAAPAPATVPLSDATMGCGSARMARTSSQVSRVNSSRPAGSRWSSSPMISFTSPPVQNALPAPVSTTTRTDGRAASARNVSVSSR